MPSDRDHTRTPVPISNRRADSHGELLQVHDRPVPGPSPLGRLAAEPGVERPGQPLQCARADVASTLKARGTLRDAPPPICGCIRTAALRAASLWWRPAGAADLCCPCGIGSPE